MDFPIQWHEQLAPPANSGGHQENAVEPAVVENPGTGDLFEAIGAVPGRLEKYAHLLSRRHAAREDAVLAVLLAVLGGALGPARRVDNPLGGSLPGSLNVMLVGEQSAPGSDFMTGMMAPYLNFVARLVESHRLKGPNLFKERVQLEQHCLEREVARSWCRAEGLGEILTADPTEIPAKSGEDHSQRLLELAFEERPWLVSDGLGPAEIGQLSTKSFDRSLLNYAPEAGAWKALLVAKPSARTLALHALHAGWRGDALVLGAETVPAVIIGNLWRVDTGIDGARWRHLRDDSIWDTFLFADAGTAEGDLDPVLLEPGKDDAWWGSLIVAVLELRACPQTNHHNLGGEAKLHFVKYCNDQRRALRALPRENRRFESRRPEQVLKVALLLHIAGARPDDVEISAPVLRKAITMVTRLGASKPALVATLFGTQEVSLESEVENMAARLRVHGTQSKRTLFRRYHNQAYGRLEKILLRGLEANRISTDGNLFASVN